MIGKRESLINIEFLGNHNPFIVAFVYENIRGPRSALLCRPMNNNTAINYEINWNKM